MTDREWDQWADEVTTLIREIGDHSYEVMKRHFEERSPGDELGEYFAQSARQWIMKQQFDKCQDALTKGKK